MKVQGHTETNINEIIQSCFPFPVLSEHPNNRSIFHRFLNYLINQTRTRNSATNRKSQELLYLLLGGFAVNFERRGRCMGFFVIVVYKLFLVPIGFPGFSHMNLHTHTYTQRLVIRVSKHRINQKGGQDLVSRNRYEYKLGF